MKKIVLFLIILSSFTPFFADAATIGVSFGAKIFFRYPCTCTGGTVWYFVLPSGQKISYTVGTQKYSTYSLPFARQILGLYNPFINEACWMGVPPYCTVVPTVGHVMPMVGSSL